MKFIIILILLALVKLDYTYLYRKQIKQYDNLIKGIQIDNRERENYIKLVLEDNSKIMKDNQEIMRESQEIIKKLTEKYNLVEEIQKDVSYIKEKLK